MEELKLLVGMVADLPSMALWVIAFFFAYKVTIIGSVYGVIRFVVERWYQYAISENAKVKTEIVRQEIHLEDLLNGLTILGDDVKSQLIVQLKRICGKRVGIKTDYMHECSVHWLRDAINEKEERDKAKEQKGAKNGM
jgi:hypothetical protein